MCNQKIMLMKKLQEELDRRTAIEEAATCLIEDGKYETAIKLLNSIDDRTVKEITDELDKLEETEKRENKEPEYIQAVDALDNLDVLKQKVIYSDTFSDISKEEQEKIYSYCKTHVSHEAVKTNLFQIRYEITKKYFGF